MLRGRFHVCWALSAACAALLSLEGCAARARVTASPAALANFSQTGVASWYGPGYDGKPTASGEIFHMNDLTAAHKTLPFQTIALVVNLKNGKTVEVRINDRGPFVSGRIIDLSREAARRIDLLGPGTVKVRVTIVKRHT